MPRHSSFYSTVSYRWNRSRVRIALDVSKLSVTIHDVDHFLEWSDAQGITGVPVTKKTETVTGQPGIMIFRYFPLEQGLLVLSSFDIHIP